MKQVLLVAGILLFSCHFMNGQNIGIGTAEPQNKLQVTGNFAVSSSTINSSAAPTAGQTHTMLNGGIFNFPGTDSVGRIYDPGGPGGNYIPNITSKVNISFAANSGIEITAESIQLGTGDSLIIKEADSPSSPVIMAIGNGYATPGKWIFNTNSLHLFFKSNNDAGTGTGFSLVFRRLYYSLSSGENAKGYVGNALVFDTKTGSLRSGNNNNAPQGTCATALGYRVLATGDYSTALGYSSDATGNYSFSSGFQASAAGNSSIALGQNSYAGGDYSVSIGGSGASNATGFASFCKGGNSSATGSHAISMGQVTNATGDNSLAFGFQTTASGNNSTAMGSYVSTNSFDGSLIIGDASTTTVLNIATANSFRARFDGGYRFFTSAAAINAESCQLPAGGNAWVTASDYRLKEKVLPADGEAFLLKIATMKLGSWNYISQNPFKQRHYGPMAQDFYAAFGKDQYGTIGNDTTINQADFDGVNLIAIQALEKRTQRIGQLEKENDELKKMLLQLRKEMDELKDARR